jgi:hypothetical protein
MFNLSTLNYRRIGYIASIGTVTLVAAWGSYRHLLDVAIIGGQPIEVAAALPLSVDGMLLCASLAMAEDKANGRIPRTWARVAFWIGATVSVAANIASTLVHVVPGTNGGMIALALAVAAWAPIALLIVTEIMARPGKPAPEDEQPEVVESAPKAERSPKDRLESARKRAGYHQMTKSEKVAWTKRYNERIARTAPTSGAPIPAGSVPTDAELEAAIA